MFPMRRSTEVPASAPRPRPSVGIAENTIALSPVIVESPVVGASTFIKAPRLHDPDAQVAVNDLVSRANMLVVQDNAERLQPEEANNHVLSDPTPNVIPTHRRTMAEDRIPSLTFRLAQKQVKTVPRHSPVHGKENVPDKPEAPVRRRRSSEGPRRIPGFFKTPVCGSGYDARRHSVVEEKEKAITKGMRHDTAAVESVVMRSIIRKNRPANLDFRAALPSIAGTPKVPSSAHSAASTPSAFSPVVQEFRGWFSSLFHWKTPTCTFHSPLNCLTTRDKAMKLLTEFGVLITLDDTLGWGVLKCKMEDKSDAGGSLTQKVRFRVEFQPYVVSLPVSPGIDGAVPLSTPQPGSHFSSTMTLIQERGALSAFRHICERLRTEWRWETLYCPDATADSGVSSGGRSSNVTGSISGFLLVQPSTETA